MNRIDYIWKNIQVMRALEFNTRIKNNQILIPSRIQTELKSKQDQVRVILLVEDSDINDHYDFQQTAKNQFLNGYTESDSIYDNY
jgi:hypothetical protein